MASRNQTPAPKVSNKGKDGKEEGQRETPAIEHMESGAANGVTPQNMTDGPDSAQTTKEMQEELGRSKINRKGNDKEY